MLLVSRRETLDDPGAIVLTAVAQAVVQAVHPTLPELDRFRYDAEAAPEWRTWYLLAPILRAQLLVARLQRPAIW
jgi:hypothetical protein